MTKNSPNKMPKSAEDLFAETQKQFSTRAFITKSLLSLYALSGVNDRIGSRRLDVIRRTKRAKFLSTALAGLSDRELSAFIGLAIANKEQAEAAFRYTAIFNFTSPITLLIVVTQVFEVRIGEVIGNGTDFLSQLLYAVIGLLLVVVTYLIIIAYGGVQFARDIYHLGIIEQSRRGMGQPVPGDLDDDELAKPADT